jgi:hypothetical protein
MYPIRNLDTSSLAAAGTGKFVVQDATVKVAAYDISDTGGLHPNQV